MYDLTLESRVLCVNSRDYSTTVKGSGNNSYRVRYGYTPVGPYQYGWTCDCMAFQTCKARVKTCKHIKAVEETKPLCGLDGFNDYLDKFPEDRKCPKCGGELKSESHGV
jgi:hypothetical protein